MKHHLNLQYLPILIVTSLILTGMLLTACGGIAPKTYTIGVVSENPALTPVIDGFKAGMAEAGYVEGKNVTYIYNGVIKSDPQVIDNEIKNLLAQKVDLLFAVGNPVALAAKKAVEGTKTPVIFAPALNPVEVGLVESIRQPGGNLAGVQTGTTIPKSMEWLLKIAPHIKKVYVPYNPKDGAAVPSIASLKAATDLQTELVLEAVDTPENMIAAVKALPKDTAIFIVPMSQDVTGLIKTATEQRIPVGAYMKVNVEQGALVNYAASLPLIGKQAAELADQVFRGTAPGDLPVETAEYFLTINLKTAHAIGLTIPDDILRQADNVIR